MSGAPAAYSLTVERTQAVLAHRAQMAQSLLARMVGLLGRDHLPPGEALILPSCRSIHTLGMRFPIDVVFVDGSWRVLRSWRDLRPGRMTPYVWAAKNVVELPAGTLRDGVVVPGDRLLLGPLSVS